MKNTCLAKLVVLLVFLSMASGYVSAQYSSYYYHRVGDTIEQDWPTYRHAWWEWLDYRASGMDATVGRTPYGSPFGPIHLMYNHTADTLKVVGMGCIGGSSMRGTLYLYDFETGVFAEKAHLSRHVDDSSRTIHISGNGWWVDRRYPGLTYEDVKPCCLNLPWDSTFGVYEYYLDTPVYVVDSFYLGCSPYTALVARHAMAHFSCQEPSSWEECDFPYQRYRCLANNNTWVTHKNWDQALLVWLIVQVDTTVPPDFVCLPLEELALSELDTFHATLSWNSFQQYTAVEVRYAPAPADTLPPDWTYIAVVGADSVSITDFDATAADFILQARAQCDSLKHNSPWSDTLRFTLPRDTTPPPCLPVEGLAVAAVDTFSVTLVWDSVPSAVALRLFMADSLPLGDTVVAGSDGRCLLPLRDTAMRHYGVAARALCDSVAERFSPWSDTLFFVLPRDSAGRTDTIGIAPVVADGVILRPNPATGSATMTSDAPLLRISLMSAAGGLVYDVPAAGHTHVIPLEAVASGAYLLRIHTTAGVVTRKLVVR